MLVYRIEHEKNGLGPYHNCECDFKRHYSNVNCPDPYEDGISKYKFEDTHYGFKCKKDLVKWFSMEHVRRFSYNQLKVFMYRVPDKYVSMGKKHLGFSLGKSTQVRKVGLWELV